MSPVTKRIEHPNRPGEWVELRMLSRHETESAYSDGVNAARVPYAVIDPTTRQMVVVGGNVASQIVMQTGIDPFSLVLSDGIVDWHLTGDDGSPLEFVKDKLTLRAMIHQLAEEHFDVQLLGADPEKENKPYAPQRFTSYLTNKLTDKATFVPNSTAPADST